VKIGVYHIGIILLLFLHVNQISAQDLIIKEGRSYTYQSQLFKYEELKDVLINSAPAYLHYEKYKSARKKAKIFGYTTLGIMATGVYYGTIKKETDCSSGGICPNKVIGVLIGLTAVLPGTIAIVYSIKAYNHRKKSINTFNNHSLKEEVSIKLGATNNGIGMVVNF
jgi:hypothetical protein